MNCCQCQGIEDLFNEKSVAKELAHYQKKGPDKTTRIMVEALKRQGVEGHSLLDIGGGVGGVQHQLLDAGVQTATDVDASQAYINAARKEADRRGVAARIHFLHGDFIRLAEQVSPADIVTLDRVLCCYPDMEQLVKLSSARAKKLYGLVYPRDTWWVKIAIWFLNLIFRLQKSPFRTFVHPSQRVEELVNRSGLRRHFSHNTLIWQVIVYAR
jgi:magnesium-protoporphyrin O-methyltransferase